MLWVPANWKEELIEASLGRPVRGFFGSLRRDPVGGGRPSGIIPEIEKEKAAEFVERAHKAGFEFAYAMGGPCLGNREYTEEGLEGIFDHLKWLSEIKADYVIVSHPLLCEIAKKRFPLKVKISTVACVNTPNALRFWEELGADIVTIDFMRNRDFQTLKKLARAARCELEVIVNDACLPSCPFRLSDYASSSHSVRDAHRLLGGFSHLRCALEKLKDPIWLLRSPWIRPEDLHEYEKIGIENFKISGREFSTSRILKALRAYSERRSPPNFAEILSSPPSWGSFDGLAAALSLDARKLAGFLEFFKRGKCAFDCFLCKWCERWKEAIKVKEPQRSLLISLLRLSIRLILEGRNASPFFAGAMLLEKIWRIKEKLTFGAF